MRYYCILTTEQLNTPIPAMIQEYMGYEQPYLLKDCIYGYPQETINGDWLCDCLLRSAPYIENNCCERELTPEEVEIWRHYVGADNVFTDTSGIELK